MCHSLYVKANGEIPCWDDVGEDHVLWSLNETPSLFHHEKLTRIRQSFLSGTVPFPSLCGNCAVRGCGTATGLKPTTMQVLHLEASYLCHLSCPQCIPAAARRQLKAPPYHMTPSMLEGLLTRLHVEGVHEILFVHLEGRGDPLASPYVYELLPIVKTYFPRAVTGATTHGSYPFDPRIVECGLDFLRVSVDGASAETYGKYRVGGNFKKVLKFLSDLQLHRRRSKNHVNVEWKYILFEWNDSDAEIERAAQFAAEMDVRLRFVLTHTPGRSVRFPNVASLKETIDRLAATASVETTFQLRTPEERSLDASCVVSEHVTSLIASALKLVQQHEEQPAMARLRSALNHESVECCDCRHRNCGALLQAHAEAILRAAAFPSTLSWLAAVCREYGLESLSTRFLWRYLELAPNAPDFDHVLQDLRRKEGLAV